MSHTETAEDSDGEIFEDAHDSPLEQRISDSIVATKDNKENGIFSLVPSRVATFPSPSQPSSTSQTDAVCNPDSFSDLFRLLAPSKPADRREKLPFPRDRHSYSLWSLLKNFVGKDVTRIALPVHLNEPLSFTQRLVEDLEYYELAHKAAGNPHSHSFPSLSSWLVSLSSWLLSLSSWRHVCPLYPSVSPLYSCQ
jgi:hypothetical protein